MTALQTTYAKLNQYSVTLSLLSEQDLSQVLLWRNLPYIRKQMTHQHEIKPEEHLAWFNRIKECQQQLHYVISYKDNKLGVINIRSRDNLPLTESDNAEVGLFIGEENYRSNIIAFAPSLIINELAFQSFNIKALSSKVRADNSPALKYNQQLGYTLSEKEQGFIPITLNQDNFNHATSMLKSFLSRGN